MNFWATFHAAAGKRMFFWASSRPEIVGPVGFAFSAGALLLLPPPLVAMIAMIPAASTTAASTNSQRLNRREDRAFWTTFTAIRSVDEKTGVRVRRRAGAERLSAKRASAERSGGFPSSEHRRFGPGPPNVPEGVTHLAERHVGLRSLDQRGHQVLAGVGRLLEP